MRIFAADDDDVKKYRGSERPHQRSPSLIKNIYGKETTEAKIVYTRIFKTSTISYSCFYGSSKFK